MTCTSKILISYNFKNALLKHVHFLQKNTAKHVETKEKAQHLCECDYVQTSLYMGKNWKRGKLYPRIMVKIRNANKGPTINNKRVNLLMSNPIKQYLNMITRK